MHSDFKNNFIRFHLLKEAEKNVLKASDFNNYFEVRSVKNVSNEDIISQLEHLESEDFLRKLSDDEYEVTNSGRKEFLEVRHAIQKFFN